MTVMAEIGRRFPLHLPWDSVKGRTLFGRSDMEFKYGGMEISRPIQVNVDGGRRWILEWTDPDCSPAGMSAVSAIPSLRINR